MRGHPPPTHTLEKKTGGLGPLPPPVPTPMNFSKYLTDWLGVSTVELCGWKETDLIRILRYVRAQKWGGARPPSAPLPGKWGGERPPFPTPMHYLLSALLPKCANSPTQSPKCHEITPEINVIGKSVTKWRCPQQMEMHTVLWLCADC